MDDEGFEIVFTQEEPASRRFRREDIFVLGMGLATGLTQAVASTLSTAHQLLAWHANYKFDQDAFHEEAAREIETLTSEDSDG